MKQYLVEHYWPGVTNERLQETSGRLRTIAEEMARAGSSVRHVRSTIVPGRTILAAVFAFVAAATATTALAVGASKDPKTLVLQKSDFPAGARVIRTINSPGGVGLARTYRYRGPGGPIDLTSSVAVLKSSSQAQAMFKTLRTEWGGLLDRITKGTSYVPRLSLPRYGDEQMATYHPLDGGKLLVRTNTVIWFLLLQDLSSQRGSRTLTKAEAAAELKRYGLKQRRRVGSG